MSSTSRCRQARLPMPSGSQQASTHLQTQPHEQFRTHKCKQKPGAREEVLQMQPVVTFWGDITSTAVHARADVDENGWLYCTGGGSQGQGLLRWAARRRLCLRVCCPGYVVRRREDVCVSAGCTARAGGERWLRGSLTALQRRSGPL